MKTLMKLLAVGIAAASSSLVLLAAGVLPNKTLYTAQIDLPSIVHHSRSAPTALQTPSPTHPGEVLGISTSRTTQPMVNTADQLVTLSQLNQRLDDLTKFLSSFGSTVGATPTPPVPTQTGATSGSTGLFNSNNGQTTAIIGGNPIVTYVPPVPANNFSGTSLAGFGSLSAGTFSSGNTTISGNLNVSGPVSASSVSSSGDATIAGAFSAATSTLSTLTVSGPAIFTGSTTIAGLTVTGLNPGLTQGSIAFQGASGLSQDNANLFYDSTNHRLGIGTTTPATQLAVAGTSFFGSNAVFQGTINGNLISQGTGTLSLNSYTLTLLGNAVLNQSLTTTSTPTFAGITINGNVGIGTTSPGSKLDLWGNLNVATSSTPALFVNTATGMVGVGTSTPGYNLTVQGTSLYTGTSIFNGNVGIGTTTPQALLSVVNGAILASGITGSTPTSGAGTRFMWIPSKGALRAGVAVGTEWDDANIGLNSIGLGGGGNDGTYAGAEASGAGSVALGSGTLASNSFSVSIGVRTVASGYGAVSLGTWGNTAAGSYSNVLGGYSNVASATRDTVVGGRSNTAQGGDSVVLAGEQNVASGVASAVLGGLNNSAAGAEALSFGYYASASSSNSTAIGEYVGVTGANSFILGQGINSSTVLLNSTPNSFAVGFNSTVPTFFVGPASGAGTLGKVGIGTTSPSQLLTVGNNNQFTVTSGGVVTNQGETVNGSAQTGNLTINGAWPTFTINDTTLNENFQIQYHEGHNALEFYNPGGAYTPIQIFANGNLNLAREGGTLAVTVGSASQGVSRLNVSGGVSIGSGYLSTAAPTNGAIVQGNVGIGQTAPSSTLAVLGGVAIGDSSYTTGVNAPTNGLIVKGNVGIGTSSPSATLQIYGSGTTNPFLVSSSTGTGLFVINTQGNVGIGTTSPQYLLQVGSASVASGTVARFQNANGTCDINPTTNTLACSSDERLKKNITPMTDDLAKVMDLQPVYFNWNAESAGTPEHPGFIAQQVRQVMPEVVSTDPTTGLLSIGYSGLVPAVVSAMQQMQAEITTLQGGLNGNASSSDLSVYVPSNFSGDSVGEAEIPAGQTSVRVSFSQPYAYQPVVTFSPEGSFIPAYIAEKDASGFTLMIEAATTTPITFDWHSFASPSEQLTVSGGTTEPIALVVATSTPVSGQELIISPDSVNSSSQPPIESGALATNTPADLGTSTPASAQAPTSTPSSTASSSDPSVITPNSTPVPTPAPVVVPTARPSPVPLPSPTPSPAAMTPPADAGTSTDAGSGSGSSAQN